MAEHASHRKTGVNAGNAWQARKNILVNRLICGSIGRRSTKQIVRVTGHQKTLFDLWVLAYRFLKPVDIDLGLPFKADTYDGDNALFLWPRNDSCITADYTACFKIADAS